jgi:hypothetical protein
VGDGADTFVIRDGRIIVQTIDYTVEVTTEDTSLAPTVYVGVLPADIG